MAETIASIGSPSCERITSSSPRRFCSGPRMSEPEPMTMPASRASLSEPAIASSMPFMRGTMLAGMPHSWAFSAKTRVTANVGTR